MARPIKKIDLEQLKQLAAINCSLKEMSHILGVSVDTLGKKYSEVISQGRSNGNMSLKRKAWQMAVQQGNVSMLTFLLKNQCGYSDRVTHEGEANPHREDYTRPDSMKAIEKL